MSELPATVLDAAVRRVKEHDAVKPRATTSPSVATEGPPDSPKGEPEPGGSWSPIDVGATVTGLLNGTISRPQPTVLTRTDGRPLFYPGKVNGIAGASGDGKSLVAQWCAVEQLALGHDVLYADLEDDAPSVVSRLLAMGAHPDVISEQFIYMNPDEPYGPGAQEQLEAVVAVREPSLVVLDSTGECLALDGAKPNDDDDVARWFRKLPTALARMGPTVLVIDHMTKADDGSLMPIGSQRKRAAIGGHQVITQLAKPFAMNQSGLVKLVCSKDRNGNYRRREVVAEIGVTSDDTTIALSVDAPANGATAVFRPTHLMERVSRHLEGTSEPLTRNAVKDAVSGNKAAIVTALGLLVEEGYVQFEQSGQAHLHSSVKPYREDMG